jgi:DNA-binding transcriptional MerR regulator
MTEKVKEANPLRPIDFEDLLSRLRLGIGQAAELCGVSIRQLSYWTDKGIIQPADGDGARTYDLEAIRKIQVIKRGLDQNHSLERAVAEADELLAADHEKKRRLAKLSKEELRDRVLEQSYDLERLADGIRREIRTRRVSGALGGSVANLGGLEKLISFFEANPYTVNTAHQIALRLGRDVGEVEQELGLLERRRFIRKVEFRDGNVYRYIPRRQS